MGTSEANRNEAKEQFNSEGRDYLENEPRCDYCGKKCLASEDNLVFCGKSCEDKYRQEMSRKIGPIAGISDNIESE